MNILTLGATGSTGRLFLDRALSRGHHVIALARNADRLPEWEGLLPLSGDVRNAQDIAGAAVGVDAVVSTLGVGSSRSPNNLIRDTARAVVYAARESNVPKVVFLSAFGVGESLEKAPVLLRIGHRLGQAVFEDKAAGDQIVKASGLNWTLAYPAVLTNRRRSETVSATALADLSHVRGLPRISRTSVAEFLLEATETDSWTKQVVVLTAK